MKRVPPSEGQLYNVGSNGKRVEMDHLVQAKQLLGELGHTAIDGGVFDDSNGHNAQLRIVPPLSSEGVSTIIKTTGLHLLAQKPSADRLH